MDGIRNLAYVEMTLEADSVDRDAVSEKALDNIIQRVGFAIDALDRVIIETN